MKKVLIFGLGISGLGVKNFCKERGIRFAVFDDNPEKCEGDYKDIKSFDVAVLSPGIPLNHPFKEEIKNAGIKIVSDLDLFKKFAPNSVKIIGVTGSNGKSTTVSLINHILQNLGKKTFLGGNIGKSPLVSEAFESEYCILEVSSFQLEITHFIFDAGVILNISHNHSKEHGGMENYIKAKERILRGEGFRLTPTDFSTSEVLEKGYSIVKQKLYINNKFVVDLPEFNNLPGEHNLKNILAAIVVCSGFAGLSVEDCVKEALNFKSLPHRIEFIREIDGTRFINDSKATSVDATLNALLSFAKTPIFLIAGGRAKEHGIKEILDNPAFYNVKEVFLIGEASGVFAKQILEHNNKFVDRPVKYSICGTLQNAVLKAFKSANKMKNGVVLLSPVASSLDQFKNFEERGEEFKKIVNNL